MSAPRPVGIPQHLREWANGKPDRLKAESLCGRTLYVGTVAGSGDQDVPGGRTESLMLQDVATGEWFELVARATVEGWGHLLLFEGRER